MLRHTASLPLLATMALVACEGIVIKDCASQFPLGDSADAIFYMEMVGVWECQELEEHPDEASVLHILRFSDTEYLIKALDEEEGASWHLRAYVTVVDDVPFLNVQSIDTTEARDRGYSFLRLDGVTVDRLLMRFVSWDQTAGSFGSSAEIREFIRANIDNDEIYNEPPTECLRTGEPEEPAA